MGCVSFLTTVSDFFFFLLQLLIFVIWGGMMPRLMKANAHLNTECRVFMSPFSFIHLKFLHHSH